MQPLRSAAGSRSTRAEARPRNRARVAMRAPLNSTRNARFIAEREFGAFHLGDGLRILVGAVARRYGKLALRTVEVAAQ